MALAGDETNEMRDCALQNQSADYMTFPAAGGPSGVFQLAPCRPVWACFWQKLRAATDKGARMICGAEPTREVIPWRGPPLRSRTCSASTGLSQRLSLGCWPVQEGGLKGDEIVVVSHNDTGICSSLSHRVYTHLNKPMIYRGVSGMNNRVTDRCA